MHKSCWVWTKGEKLRAIKKSITSGFCYIDFNFVYYINSQF